MRRYLTLAAALLGLAWAGPARAAILVTATEVGSDVVVSASGTANLAGLAVYTLGGAGLPGMTPAESVMAVGDVAGGSFDSYQALSGPASFGPGDTSVPTSGTGDLFAVSQVGGVLILIVPESYASGSALEATNVYEGQSFASLGMTAGTYVWTWGSGADADSFTLQVGAAVVPEPSSFALAVLGGLGLLGAFGRRRAR